MPKSAQRDVLRELARLVRVPDESSSNIGEFVATNAGELAPLLSTTPRDLEASRALTDEQIVVRLRPRLERACLYEADVRARRRAEEAQVAAERLAAAAQWEDGRVVLPMPLFFCRHMWAVPGQHALLIAEEREVVVRREAMADARAVLPKLPASEVFLERDGLLHFRWCNGRGRLNLRARPLDREERARALVIALAQPKPASASVRRAGMPTLLGDVLAELGFG